MYYPFTGRSGPQSPVGPMRPVAGVSPSYISQGASKGRCAQPLMMRAAVRSSIILKVLLIARHTASNISLLRYEMRGAGHIRHALDVIEVLLIDGGNRGIGHTRQLIHGQAVLDLNL